MTTSRLPVAASFGFLSETSFDCFVDAVTSTGRRFVYGYSDGSCREYGYRRPLTLEQAEWLIDAVTKDGWIDEMLPCWVEQEPIYGTPAYRLWEAEMDAQNAEYNEMLEAAGC